MNKGFFFLFHLIRILLVRCRKFYHELAKYCNNVSISHETFPLKMNRGLSKPPAKWNDHTSFHHTSFNFHCSPIFSIHSLFFLNFNSTMLTIYIKYIFHIRENFLIAELTCMLINGLLYVLDAWMYFNSHSIELYVSLQH